MFLSRLSFGPINFPGGPSGLPMPAGCEFVPLGESKLG